LIGIFVLSVYMWLRSKNKFAFGLVMGVVALLMIYMTSTAWNQRVATIGDFQQENSAYTRILVWRWVLEFTATHPLGGGFQAFTINHIDFPATATQPATIQFARAYHSIYFEVLGEQGYPGLLMYLTITALTFYKLNRIGKQARAYPELEWVRSLSGALQSGLAVFLSAGAFVGIAFQPMFWYFIAMSISLNAYMWRVQRLEVKPVAGWRGMVAHTTGPRPAQPDENAWRGRPASGGNAVLPPR
jgi:putative inorganic carbon (hco3(-)) transporter